MEWVWIISAVVIMIIVLTRHSAKRMIDWVWNLMAHAQKPDFIFRRNGRVHLNRRKRQFSRLLAAPGVRISGSNAGYIMFRGSVKSIVYPLHSPVSPSLPLPCVTVCHHISAGVYYSWSAVNKLLRHASTHVSMYMVSKCRRIIVSMSHHFVNILLWKIFILSSDSLSL